MISIVRSQRRRRDVPDLPSMDGMIAVTSSLVPGRFDSLVDRDVEVEVRRPTIDQQRVARNRDHLSRGGKRHRWHHDRLAGFTRPLPAPDAAGGAELTATRDV